jgi:hypothetical protein
MRNDRRRSRPPCCVFLLRFGCRHSLLDHPLPAEGLGSPHGRLTGPRAGPRRGSRVPHARAAPGLGALCAPRTAVLLPAKARSRPAPAALPRLVPKPRHNIPPCEAALHEASIKGSGSSPVRASPRPRPQGGTGNASASPELRTPPLPAAHVRGGDRPSSTGLELVAQHHTVDPPVYSSLVSCDIASHRAKHVSPRPARDSCAVTDAGLATLSRARQSAFSMPGTLTQRQADADT